MASPDERQGDRTATTTCYSCNEIPQRVLPSSNPTRAGLDLPLRPPESAKPQMATNIVEEQTMAPIASIGGNNDLPTCDIVAANDVLNYSTMELEER